MSQVTPFIRPVQEPTTEMQMVRPTRIQKAHGVNKSMKLIRKKRKAERQNRKNAR